MNTSVLLNYRQRLTAIGTNNDRDFISTYEQFLRDFSTFDTKAFDRMKKSVFLCHSEFFTNCQKRYLSIKERESVKSLLEAEHKGRCSLRDLLTFQFGKNSYDRVKDLSENIDFTRCRRAVMVGCGALPVTLFWLYDHYPNIDYIGLDIDADCVALASKALGALKIKGARVLHQDGREFDFSGVDFIFIANQVSPKKTVLEQIANTADTDVQLVVRNPTHLGKLFAECIRDNCPGDSLFNRRGTRAERFYP